MARNGRFNKILEFIGLVDDEPEEDLREDRGRPAGAQSYPPPSSRRDRSSAAKSSRQTRDRELEEDRPRYSSSPRPDYDARRRNDYQPTPRYAPQDAFSRDYRSSAARTDYAQARQTNYERGAYRQEPPADYASGRSARSDPFAEAFDSPRQAPRASRQAESAQPDRPRDNVVAMRQTPSTQTVIYYLRALEECRDVINDLLDNKTVLLNLEDMDERVVQRAIDTLCGAAFALNATLRKASDKTYLIAPNSVQVASTNDAERRY